MASLFNFEVTWETKWNMSPLTTNNLMEPNVHATLNPCKSIGVISNPSCDKARKFEENSAWDWTFEISLVLQKYNKLNCNGR